MEQSIEEIESQLHDTMYHVFLTGNAGTGKSTLIQKFISEHEGECVVLAPTGIAAVNVGGQTIHRFFHFPARAINYDAIKKLRPAANCSSNDQDKIDLLRACKYIIIDEMSMVRADMMDQIGWFFHKNAEVLGSVKPFAGIKLIMVGDLSQLPPVVKDEDRESIQQRYKSEFFFDANCWTKYATFKTIKLTKIWRQKDPEFIGLLNSVKNGTVGTLTIDRLNAKCLRTGKLDPIADGVLLAATNAVVDTTNAMMLDRIEGEDVWLNGKVNGDFDLKSVNVEKEIRVKAGARIMLMRNNSLGAYFNGSMGTFLKYCPEDETCEIQLDGWEGVLRLNQHKFEEINFEADPITKKVKAKSTSWLLQFPIRVAYAISIHKSQGKTFDKGIIDMGERGAFAHGQLYVALSRFRSIEGIILRRPIRMSDVILNGHVKRFLE